MLKPKISMSQLIMLLALSRMFYTLNGILLGTGDGYGMAYLWAIPLSALMQFLLLLPALFLSHRQGTSVITAGYSLWGKGGAVLAFLCGVYFLLCAVLTVFSTEQFMVNAIYPQAWPVFFILTLTLAAGYAAHLGLESIARCGFIIFIVFVCGVAFAFLGNWRQINLIFIRPLGTGGFGEVLRIAVNLTARSPEILLFAVLLPNLGKDAKKKRGAIYYLLLSSLLLEIIVFLISAVLGQLAEGEAFPFYTVGSLAKISIFQRLDAVHMSIWVLTAFVRMGLFLWAAVELFQSLMPVKKHRFVLPFLGLLALIGGMLCGMEKGAANGLYSILFSVIPIFVFLPLVSIALLITEKAKESEPKGGTGHED